MMSVELPDRLWFYDDSYGGFWVLRGNDGIWRPIPNQGARRGFTLIELCVVLAIISILVGAVASSGLIGGIQHRQVSQAAGILQGALAGARDAAIRDNAPTGIRLLTDPIQYQVKTDSTGKIISVPYQLNVYAVSRFIPITTAPSYTNGLVSVFPKNTYDQAILQNTKALVLEESPSTPDGLLAEPTSWFWNVRIGDRVQINRVGPTYTVAGPCVLANVDCFVNNGAPGTKSPLGHDWLLLTNGRDDNANGYIDEGWDGIDNDGDGIIDNSGEWEPEAWLGALASGVTAKPYAITRRPAPAANAREVALPSNVVIDLQRSKIDIDPVLSSLTFATDPITGAQIPLYTAQIDIVISPNGSAMPSIIYSTPARLTLGSNFAQFWLSERDDLGMFQQTNPAPAPPVYVPATPTGNWWLVTLNGTSGRVSSMDQPDLVTGLVTARQGIR